MNLIGVPSSKPSGKGSWPSVWLRKSWLIAAAVLASATASAQFLLPQSIADQMAAAQRALQTQTQTVSLQSNSGKFVSAQNDQVKVTADRNAVGDWEKWQANINGNTVVFKSSWGKLLSAQADGSVVANRTEAGPWERFSMEDTRGGFVAFKTAHGTYLTAEPGGALMANRKQAGDWERFKMTGIGSVAGANPPTQSNPPPATAYPPTASNPGASNNSDFYWSDSYGRGAGTVGYQYCGANGSLESGLCYNKCDAGFHGDGPLCTNNQPTSYGRGAGQTPITDTWFWGARIRCPGSSELSGAVCYDKCRSGYHGAGPVCWINSGSYGRNAGAVPMLRCPESMDTDASLCYAKCRDGFHGVGPVCWANVPVNYVSCGFGVAKDDVTCGFVIADQVLAVQNIAEDICKLFPQFKLGCTVLQDGQGVVKVAQKFKLKPSEVMSFLAKKFSGSKGEAVIKALDAVNPEIAELVNLVKVTKVVPQVKTLEDVGRVMKDLTSKSVEAVRPLMTGDNLKKIATLGNKIRKEIELPPFQAQGGTETEQAFSIIRDTADIYSILVTIEATKKDGGLSARSQALKASADALSLVTAYLYTVRGQ